MRFSYHPNTDALYIHLSEEPSVNADEVIPGVVFDYDTDGKLVGFDIDHVSMVANISLPAMQEVSVAQSESSSIGSMANGHSLSAPDLL